QKNVGLGLKLPLYASGSKSVGWWAMFITMIGDMSAFFSLVFGYFFFWTVREDFPPEPSPGPGLLWPLVSVGLVGIAWSLTLLAGRWNSRNREAGFHAALTVAALLTTGGALALLAGPYL